MALQLAPSILDADFGNIGKAIKMLEEGGAHWLHLDVMDNHFVPNLTFGPAIASSFMKMTKMPSEAHLMVKNAGSLLKGFQKAGCKRIIVHPEGELHFHRLLQQIEALDMEPGIVINPATPVSSIEPVLHMAKLVLVMTVNPGFGGQAFIEEALDKVRMLAALKEDHRYDYRIQVDGGVKMTTIEKCVAAGADTFVIGSAIFKAEEPAKALSDYLERLKALEKGIE